MKKKKSCELKDHKPIKTTLLIPKKYLLEMENTSMALQFSSLIEKYLPIIENDLELACSNVTTRYQEEGLDLQRVDFRPIPDEWAIFKITAIGHGVSMCFLFAYILELERLEAEANSVRLNSLLVTHCMNALLPLNQKKGGVPPLAGLECGLLFKKPVRKYDKFFEIKLK